MLEHCTRVFYIRYSLPFQLKTMKIHKFQLWMEMWWKVQPPPPPEQILKCDRYKGNSTNTLGKTLIRSR